MVIGPLVAPGGTITWIWVEAGTEGVPAVVPANFTTALATKFMPSMITRVPGPPPIGEKLEITGAVEIMNESRLWPAPAVVVIVIGPVLAAGGTVARIWVVEVTPAAAVSPLNLT